MGRRGEVGGTGMRERKEGRVGGGESKVRKEEEEERGEK